MNDTAVASATRAKPLREKDNMPRYFFDIVDGQAFPDTEGTDLPDLAAARIEAVRLSAEVLKEMPERFWMSEEWTMTVRDQLGHPLFKLKFSAETFGPERVA
jgi:hypothetical protein